MAEAADVILLCVPNSPQVVEVVDDMLPALGSGQTVVDCSTIDPDVERAQHSQGERHRRPLSRCAALWRFGWRAKWHPHPDGGRGRVDTGRHRASPDPFSGLIVHVGGPGMGQVVKLCNNLIYAAQMTATAEATALAVKSGVDMRKLYRSGHALVR